MKVADDLKGSSASLNRLVQTQKETYHAQSTFVLQQQWSVDRPGKVTSQANADLVRPDLRPNRAKAMRRGAKVTAALALITMSGCTYTIPEGGTPPKWWQDYTGPRQLNIILEGDPSEDHEYFQDKCARMGGETELIAYVDRFGNVTKFVCENVDF